MANRPTIVTDDMLTYLDDLRKSGKINMFEAPSWVKANFDVSRTDSREIVLYWMETFGNEDR